MTDFSTLYTKLSEAQSAAELVEKAHLDEVAAERLLTMQANATRDEAITANVAAVAEIARLNALLRECGDGGQYPMLGNWGGGSLDEMEDLERVSGQPADVARSRGGEGQMDNSFYDQSKVFVEAGYIPSLQFQPKTGRGSQRAGVGVERILRGAFDATLMARYNELRDLPEGMVVPFERVSEANIQQAQRESQPFLADYSTTLRACRRPMTPDEYVALLRYLDTLERGAGVRDRLHTIVTLTRGCWNSTSPLGGGWDRANMTRLLQPLVDDGVVDGIAADGYSGDRDQGGAGKYGWNWPADIVKGVKATALDLGVPWSVMETGVQSADGTDKARWYREWQNVVDENMRYLVLNITREQDSDALDFRPTAPDSTALAGYIQLARSINEGRV